MGAVCAFFVRVYQAAIDCIWDLVTNYTSFYARLYICGELLTNIY